MDVKNTFLPRLTNSGCTCWGDWCIRMERGGWGNHFYTNIDWLNFCNHSICGQQHHFDGYTGARKTIEGYVWEFHSGYSSTFANVISPNIRIFELLQLLGKLEQPGTDNIFRKMNFCSLIRFLNLKIVFTYCKSAMISWRVVDTFKLLCITRLSYEGLMIHRQILLQTSQGIHFTIEIMRN